jgi:hypothetical protein
MYDLFVNNFLVYGMKVWDSHKVNSLFSESVAEHFLSTPLFEEVREDRLVWKHEIHGEYTVKSGYKNYIKRKAGEDRSRIGGEWSFLWRAAAPPKTKHLLWRICCGCLPTRVPLRGRYVSCSSECRTNNEKND